MMSEMSKFDDDDCFIGILPLELLLIIYSLLKGKDMSVLPRVCNEWRKICKNYVTIKHITHSNEQRFIDFFEYTKLTSIYIPNTIKSIGMYAFYECRSLTSIIIPKSVTFIGS